MWTTKASWLLLLPLLGPLLLASCVWPESSNWTEQVELELQRQPNKLAYCRTLQRLQLEYEETSCGQILEDDPTTTGELLMETEQRCWSGWELFGRRCRKRA